MIPRRSVLVVDPLQETREVLRTVLERRGMRIFAASDPEQGLALARRHRPDLIVLDLECESARSEAISGGFAAESLAHDTPLVLLGSARRRAGKLRTGEFVSKPYHYAPLIRKIEELLQAGRSGV